MYRGHSHRATPIPDLLHDTEKWQCLDDQYGLLDMFDDPVQSTRQMTVDEVYVTYVNAPLSPKGTSIIKYWEVRQLLLDVLPSPGS